MPPDSERSQTVVQGTPRWRTLIVLAVALAALFVAELVWTSLRQSHQPTGEARWIWSRHSSRYSRPEAFYAVRDFELDEAPEEATLLALGDEEYRVYLNGRAVGSNRYQTGAELDRYDVASYLRPGRNRIVTHLRSANGDGGFLATLYTGAGTDPITVTDESWQISYHRTPRMMDPAIDIDRSRRAVVVADPPAGRWGAMSEGVDRPLSVDLLAPREEVRSRRILVPGKSWTRLSRLGTPPGTRLGEHVVFDFGRRRTGFLMLRIAEGEPGLGLVYLGLDPPDPRAQPPDATVITSRGEQRWLDTVPRTFRYAMVVGLDQLTGAAVYGTDPTKLEPVVAGTRPEGVFGLEAPRLRTPIENVVWSELEGFTGDAEGQSR